MPGIISMMCSLELYVSHKDKSPSLVVLWCELT